MGSAALHSAYLPFPEVLEPEQFNTQRHFYSFKSHAGRPFLKDSGVALGHSGGKDQVVRATKEAKLQEHARGRGWAQSH